MKLKLEDKIKIIRFYEKVGKMKELLSKHRNDIFQNTENYLTYKL